MVKKSQKSCQIIKSGQKLQFQTILFPYNGPSPILRQQGDSVGVVRKMAISADVQFYLC